MIRVNAAAASNVSPSVTRTKGGGFVAFVVALVCATAVFWLPWAAPAGAETEIGVDAGVDGRFRVGSVVPVTVTISADRLLAGDLTVFVRNSPTGSVRTPIDMAGGTTKEVTVLVPSGPWDSNITVQAVLRSNGEEVDSVRAQVNAAVDDELVGVLPDLVQQASVPNTSPLAVDLGVARFSEISVEQLSLGSGALDVFGIIAATATDLADLTDDDRNVLTNWLSKGGILLVDEAVGTPLPSFPDEWQPGSVGYAFAGEGEVRLTAGAATSGDWGEILFPSPLMNLNEQQMLGEWVQSGNWSSVTSTLGNDAGFRLPPVTTVVLLLLFYIAIVGPVTFMVLTKMRLQTKAWVAVPALATLFAGVVWFAGSDLRGSTRRAHATLIEQSPAGAAVQSFVLAGSGRGDNISIDLPNGWSGLPNSDNRFGPNSEVPDLSIANTSRLELDIDPGGFGLFGATGIDVDSSYALDVVADATDDDVIEGTVTNNSPITLKEVEVYAYQERVSIGTIEPGEARTFTIRGADNFQMWMNEFGGPLPPIDGPFGQQNPESGPVNAGLLSNRFRSGGVNTRSPGQVLAVGWTRDAPAPFGDPEVGRTGVLARSSIGSSGQTLSGLSFRRYLVRGPSSIRMDVANQGFGPEAAGAYRFVAPPNVAERANNADLVVDVPRFAGQVDAWNGTEWVPLSGGAQVADRRGTAVALPNGAFVDGAATLRMAIAFDGPEGGRDLMIRERTADDPPAEEGAAK